MLRICKRAPHASVPKLAQVSTCARSLNKVLVLFSNFFLDTYAQVLAQHESFKITSQQSNQAYSIKGIKYRLNNLPVSPWQWPCRS